MKNKIKESKISIALLLIGASLLIIAHSTKLLKSRFSKHAIIEYGKDFYDMSNYEVGFFWITLPYDTVFTILILLIALSIFLIIYKDDAEIREMFFWLKGKLYVSFIKNTDFLKSRVESSLERIANKYRRALMNRKSSNDNEKELLSLKKGSLIKLNKFSNYLKKNSLIIILILVTSLSVFRYVNLKLSERDILGYQLEMSMNSLHNLKIRRIETSNFKVMKYEFIGSFRNIIPLYQIKTLKRLNYLKSLTQKPGAEWTALEKELLISYKKHLESKELYSSIGVSYNVEMTLLFIKILGFIIPFVLLYYFLPKLIKKAEHKKVYLRILISLIILTFVFYQVNNSITKEVNSEFKFIKKDTRFK